MPENKYRYERKFFISDLSEYELEGIVKLNPFIFSEIYHQRFVNNIYFDSPDLDNFFDNVDGSPHRKKVRIRWYGDKSGYIERPVLEIKIKKGQLGRKESFRLLPFEFNNDVSLDDITRLIDESDIPETISFNMRSQTPFLLNRYSRSYYLSADKRFRITIDKDQLFYRISNRHHFSQFGTFDDRSIILELKYDQECDKDASRITNCFPFRVTKSSKYVNGIVNAFQIPY